MAAMDGMPMPGGWTMSMAWMRMPGQTWPSAAASFVGMWSAMMVAMMLPSLLPMLVQYRRAVGDVGEVRLARLTALVGAGYFGVWSAIGLIVYPFGAAVAAIAMEYVSLARAVPMAVGAVVLCAGLLQFSARKAHYLECCRAGSSRRCLPQAGGIAAWRHGIRLGIQCAYCCAGPMAVLLVLGVMDLRAMGAVAAAITTERLAPRGRTAARAFGVLGVVAGVGLIARAASLA